MSMFSLNGDLNITEEKDLWVFNGMLSVNVSIEDVLSCKGIYAPPYASSNFLLRIKVSGKTVDIKEYEWTPWAFKRKGVLEGVTVSSSLIPIVGMRGIVLAINLENTDRAKKNIPLQLYVKSGLSVFESKDWKYEPPITSEEYSLRYDNRRLIIEGDSGAIVVGLNVDDLEWDRKALSVNITLEENERRTIHVAIGIGSTEEARSNCDAILDNPEKAIEYSFEKWQKKINDLFTKLPRLEAESEQLVKFYNRSLLSFLLCQWQVPEFILHPYYSTSGIDGGAVCCYVWDISYGCEIFPLYDPEALKEHIKQFLKTDLTSHFAFTPLDGTPTGPWYAYNHYSIVSMIYYYVLHTGDTEFLKEKVNGKSILERAIYHATYKDDLNKPVELIDYGNNRNLLELRRTKYEHYVPSPNGERYFSYKAVDTLCKLAGREPIGLSERAEALKKLIKEKLWDKEDKWFFHLDENMRKGKVYTIQVFDLLRTGVLDKEEEEGILTHLNKEEFLSKYGIHSLSKKDKGYDLTDVDWGGPGVYTGDAPQIIEDLYKSGHPELAEDILRRILWWGERMPYYPQAVKAAEPDYRHDGRANIVAGITVAQAIIFGMFGVKVEPNGDIIINPHPPRFSPELKLTGLKILGKNIDIYVKGEKYEVKIDNKIITSKVGNPTIIRHNE